LKEQLFEKIYREARYEIVPLPWKPEWIKKTPLDKHLDETLDLFIEAGIFDCPEVRGMLDDFVYSDDKTQIDSFIRYAAQQGGGEIPEELLFDRIRKSLEEALSMSGDNE